MHAWANPSTWCSHTSGTYLVAFLFLMHLKCACQTCFSGFRLGSLLVLGRPLALSQTLAHLGLFHCTSILKRGHQMPQRILQARTLSDRNTFKLKPSLCKKYSRCLSLAHASTRCTSYANSHMYFIRGVDAIYFIQSRLGTCL